MRATAAGSLAAQLAEKNAQLIAEKQLRQAAEARTGAQIQKLADNNTALARLNNRLTSQLDRLRADYDKLQHLAAGQQAVARAKEAELATEINGLKRLLRESLSERTTLHAQLLAKQEIVRYLEWRLGQMEQVAKGVDPIPSSAAFRAAARVAAGEPPEDSFAVLPDVSASTQSSSASGIALPRTLMALGQRGLVGIPAATWARPGAEIDKENLHATGPQGGTPARRPQASPLRNTGQFPNMGTTLRGALADITPRRAPSEATGASFAAPITEAREAAPAPVLRSIRSNDESSNTNLIEVLEEAVGDSTAQSVAAGPERSEADESTIELDSLQKKLFTESYDNSKVNTVEEEGEAVDGVPPLHTPLAQLTPSAASTEDREAATVVATTGLRSSSRARRRVSYAMPAVNRKLRQGDPFTFGDPSSIHKKGPRSRTKPRAKYPSSAESSRLSRSAGRSTPQPRTLASMREQEDCSDGSGEEI